MTPQTLLLLLLLLLALASLAPIVLPLLKRGQRAAAAESPAMPVEEGASLWRDQRAELDRARRVGLIDDVEHAAQAQALTQAARSDLQDSAVVAPLRQVAPRSRRPVLAIVLVVLLLAIALPLYWVVGSPDIAERLNAQNVPSGQQGARPADPQVLAMVQALAQKMDQHPEDVKGWTLLGRSYMVLGNYGESTKAYRRALVLAPRDASILCDLADADAMLAGGRLDGEPSAFISQALSIDPNYPKALELAGTAALQRRDPQSAKVYWTRLRAVMPANSEDLRQVDAALAQLDTVLSGTSRGPEKSENNAGSAGASAASAAPALPLTSPKAMASAEAGTISGSVDIAPGIAGRVNLTDVVYLSAHAAAGPQGGPRIPLAVMRLEARQLPASFTLSDAMAMDPSHKLSDATEVVIEAHIAKHGTPILTSGDLAAKPVTATLGATGLTLVIDHVAP